jgi:murein DD-endopeptidase MepM/ murein hydrolase activator NlpD
VRGLVVLVAAGVAALTVPALARAYEWPIAPFDRQHPIRGAFDDPRLHLNRDGTLRASFHFGIDIAAPGGTPVYSVSSGTVFREPDAVVVRADGHEFSYWHVRASVHEHQTVETHQLLGRVKPMWGHVHFAESVDGRYVNPLRPGGLRPFVDTTTPVVADLEVLGGEGQDLDPQHLRGTIGLVANLWDPTPEPLPPPPWEGSRLMPAFVRWRLVSGTDVAVPWTIVVDFRTDLLPAENFDRIYDSRGTWQNKPDRPGRYLVWLTHGLDTAQLAAGAYRVEVEASDLAGNTTTRSFDVAVDQTPRSTNDASAYTRRSRRWSPGSSVLRNRSHAAP